MKISFKGFLFVLLLALGSFTTLQSLAPAQTSFPTRPVNIWVGFPPGGGTDIIIRALAEGTEKSLKQKIVVMNKPGGGGTVCASLLAKEKPDGYTLGGNTDTPVTRSPHLLDLNYDPLKDFSFILRVGKWKNVFVVRADSPFKKWQDLVDWAKKNPGQLTFGHCTASSFYFGMVAIGKKEGFTFKGVPYACDAPTMTAVLGGHVMLGGGTAAPYRSHVVVNNIRILLSRMKVDYAEGHGQQSTFKDMHYDFELPLLAEILAPKGLPDNVRAILEKAFMDGMKSDVFKKVAQDQELLVRPMTGKPLFDYLKKTSATYEELIKEVGLYKSEKK